ncbi:ABC transporter ATP-binding protein [uncultured Cocleimonas sp.]|uniref:ABC transporter ATP-binding protein n=1 Tax=uncultured Cocleimonas sp. TaxID=1051587 RepID=UPI00262B9BF0|nr:ABC transporter ATP-binding protein [uncultured Cocleimonas sp.]
MSSLVTVKAINKIYEDGLIRALNGVDLVLEHGKIYALMGASGCGKSSLLNIIGTLDNATSGDITYEGTHKDEILSMSKFRQEFVGFVFQFHHLIPVLTLRENVESALLPIHRFTLLERKNLAMESLEEMDIAHYANSFPEKISGGERQRGAIARALINKPKLLLADEPTGNVDSKTAKKILVKMRDYVSTYNSTILIATHDKDVAELADVVIQMKDGKIIFIEENLSINNGKLKSN